LERANIEIFAAIVARAPPFRLHGLSYMKELSPDVADSTGRIGGANGGRGYLIEKSRSDTRPTQARTSI
jgi:hypothetical protein